MDLATGAQVDRYIVEGILGEGGMAIVYLCRHAQLGTKHALKVLTMSSRAIRERLVQEGQVQASLRHRNIVAVTDIIVINGAPGLVMEYIEGPSLDELLDQQNLTYAQADALVEGLLAGVAHAHAMGLVHRDLKPANIMLAVEGNELIPKVMDFGLAKLIEGSPERKAATRTGSTMGTPQYMSPEQVEDSKNVDHRTDVFACGAILYELVTGHRAFSGDSMYQIFGAVAEGQYRNPRELRADLPERMENAILGALTPDRGERIQTIDELLAVWKGQTVRSGPAPVEPTGPFSSAFFANVRSLTTEVAPSVPDPTFAMGSEVAVNVESLFHKAPEGGAPAAAPPAGGGPVPPPNPSRREGSPARSVVKGTAIMMGGGAMLLGLGVLGLSLVLGGAGAAYVFLLPGPELPVEVKPEAGSPAGVEVPLKPAPTTKPGPSPQRPPPPSPASVVVAPDPKVDEVVAVEPVDEPPPLAKEATAELADLDRISTEGRIEAIEALWINPNSAAKLVWMARNDPDPDVAVRAWQAVTRQYKSKIGSRAILEPLIVENLWGGRYPQVEAISAYGKRGTDLSLLKTPLAKGKARTKNTAVTAIVAIGKRTDSAAAKRMLQGQVLKSRGPMRIRIEAAIAQL